MDIFEGVKDELFNDVEEGYHQRLEEGYKKHLSGTLNKIELNDSNYKAILMDEIELNNKVLGDYAGPFKLALYLYDESFEELNSLSLTGYHLALDRLKNNVTIDADEVNKNIERMDKLFNELAPKYEGRVGGYTRILKMEPRRGDNSKQAILMLI